VRFRSIAAAEIPILGKTEIDVGPAGKAVERAKVPRYFQPGQAAARGIRREIAVVGLERDFEAVGRYVGFIAFLEAEKVGNQIHVVCADLDRSALVERSDMQHGSAALERIPGATIRRAIGEQSTGCTVTVWLRILTRTNRKHVAECQMKLRINAAAENEVIFVRIVGPRRYGGDIVAVVAIKPLLVVVHRADHRIEEQPAR